MKMFVVSRIVVNESRVLIQADSPADALERAKTAKRLKTFSQSPEEVQVSDAKECQLQIL